MMVVPQQALPEDPRYLQAKVAPPLHQPARRDVGGTAITPAPSNQGFI